MFSAKVVVLAFAAAVYATPAFRRDVTSSDDANTSVPSTSSVNTLSAPSNTTTIAPTSSVNSSVNSVTPTVPWTSAPTACATHTNTANSYPAWSSYPHASHSFHGGGHGCPCVPNPSGPIMTSTINNGTSSGIITITSMHPCPSPPISNVNSTSSGILTNTTSSVPSATTADGTPTSNVDAQPPTSSELPTSTTVSTTSSTASSSASV